MKWPLALPGWIGRGRARRTIRRRPVLEELENRVTPSTLVPLSNVRDLVYDPLRNLLYVSTSTGTIQRYDPGTRSLLTPWNVGGSPQGIDLTPAGTSLYVADTQLLGGQGVIRKVDLNLDTGAASLLTYSPTAGEGSAWDIAVAANGRALFSATSTGASAVPLRQINLTNDAISVRGDAPGSSTSGILWPNASITRAPNHSLLLTTEANPTNGQAFTYDSTTDSFPRRGARPLSADDLSAVNRNGTLLAVEQGGVIQVLTNDLTLVQSLSLDGGVTFDPRRNLVYAVNSVTDQVIAYDTTSWVERFRLDIGENIGPSRVSSGAPVSGVMTVSGNGRFLFLATPSGVRTFDLPSGDPRVIDDDEPGYQEVGTWTRLQLGLGFQDDYRTKPAGVGQQTASWTFTGLTPGVYSVAAIWYPEANRADNAPYTIINGGVALATLQINQKEPPNDFNAVNVWWENLGNYLITETRLIVRLSDAANGPINADAIRIERIGDLSPAPEIEVREGHVDIPDDILHQFTFGFAIPQGSPITKTFTVRNTGALPLLLGTLTLTQPQGGWSIAAPFGATTLAPGEFTTFRIRREATSLGSSTAQLAITSNDGDENPFEFTLTGSVVATPTIVRDDGVGSFTTVGTWATVSGAGAGFGDDHQRAAPGTGQSVATWYFNFIPSGRYRVSATWTAAPDRARNAPFTVLDRNIPLATVRVNQEIAPNDFQDQGVLWEDLGGPYLVYGNDLYVTLSNDADDFVIADAVRIQRVDDLPAGPEVEVFEGVSQFGGGGTPVADNTGRIDYGPVPQFTPVTRTFTIRNPGNADLTLTLPISVSAGFTLVTGPATSVLVPGSSTTFSLRLDSATLGPIEGQVSFGTNDSDEGQFNFTVAAVIFSAPPEIQVSAFETFPLLDDLSSFNFHATGVGYPQDHLFRVNNLGTGTLLLGPLRVPAGVSVVSSFGTTALAPGGSTTFTLRLNATAVGSYVGEVSFDTNDADENPFNFRVRGWVGFQGFGNLINDRFETSPGSFWKVGDWVSVSGMGFDNNVNVAPAGNGSSQARWMVPELTPGAYRVAVTWTVEPDRASNVPYTIFEGTTPLATVRVDQRQPPDDFPGFGVRWEYLPGTYTITDPLAVQISNDANGTVSADAIQFEYLGQIPLTVQVQVQDGLTHVGDGGNVSFGVVPPGSSQTKVFQVFNGGQDGLTLGPISLPPGFSLVTGFGTNVLAPRTKTTFTIRMNTTGPSSSGGMLSFANNDPLRNPFNFTVSGTTGLLPEIQVTAVAEDVADGFSVIHVGQTTLGTPRPFPFLIRNLGQGDLIIGTPITLPHGFTMDAPLLWPVVAPGSTLSLVIRITAAQAGRFRGEMSFWNNDTNENPFNFTIIGDVAGPAPDIQVLEGTREIIDNLDLVTFGPTIVGVPVSKTFTVRNIGTAPLTLNGPITLPAGYSVTSGFGTTNLVPGQSTTFTIRLNAASSALFRGELSFETNDSDSNVFNFTLEGIAQAVPPLLISGLRIVPAGFTIDFSRALDVSTLNLYDTETAGFGPADVTVVGAATGAASGTLVVEPSNLRIAFVRTGGPLPPDTYTVRLRGAPDGFRTTSGSPMDGEANGNAGGDFVFSFTVNPSSSITVSIPDVVRGPGQMVDVPAGGSGLPLRLSDGDGVISVSLTLRYNPALLTLTGAVVAPGLPVGSTAMLDTATAGAAVVIFTSPTHLPAGARDIVRLIATVPNDAPYTSKHVLDLEAIYINDSIGRDEDGVHVVAYLGDTTANGRYSARDAQRVLRVALGLDRGFSTYQLADPVLLADITGNGTITSTDATRILQESLGIDQVGIPPLPANPPVLLLGGPDPLLYFPKRLRARPGGTVTVPLLLTPSDGLEAADLAIAYNTRQLEVVSVRRGGLTHDFDLFAVHLDPEAGTINVGLSRDAGPITGRGSGSVIEITFRVRTDAPLGLAVVNLRQSSGSTMTWLNEGGLDLNPDPSDDVGDELDGLIQVLAAPVDLFDLVGRKKRRQ